MTQPPGDPVASAPPPSPTAPPRSDSNFVPPPRYTPETGCAASADQRGDPLFASAPPAERWLLIETSTPWPRNALTALRRSPDSRTPQAALDPPTLEARTPQGDLRRADLGTGAQQGDLGRADLGTGAQQGDLGRADLGTGAQQGDLGGADLGTGAQQGDLGRLTAGPRAPQANISRPAAQAATNSADPLPAEIAQLCAQLRCRPVLIRRHGRSPAGTPRRWFLVDSRPGHESIRTGELPTDEHLLAVLSGADPGTPTTDPIYLVCTHGRHDACCAVRGRPAAAALTAAYPDRTWECSHIGGDRFAANLVFLPHSHFYGHVPADQAVALARSYNEGTITPTYYRGSGAHPPPVQAAQHFARTAGHSLAINALHPIAITQPAPNHWSVTLSTTNLRPADPEASTAPSPPTHAGDGPAGTEARTVPGSPAAAGDGPAGTGASTAPATPAGGGDEPDAGIAPGFPAGSGDGPASEPGLLGVPAEPTRPVPASTPSASGPGAATPGESALNGPNADPATPGASAPIGSTASPGASAPNDYTPGATTPGATTPGASASGGSTSSLHFPNHGRSITVEVRAEMITVDGQMTCAAKPPGQFRQFTLAAPISTPADDQ